MTWCLNKYFRFECTLFCILELQCLRWVSLKLKMSSEGLVKGGRTSPTEFFVFLRLLVEFYLSWRVRRVSLKPKIPRRVSLFCGPETCSKIIRVRPRRVLSKGRLQRPPQKPSGGFVKRTSWTKPSEGLVKRTSWAKPSGRLVERLPDFRQFLEIDSGPKPLRNRIENAPF